MKRIVLALVFAVGVAACGAEEEARLAPAPTAQPTATPLPTPRPKPTARPSPRRATQPTPAPLREHVYVVQAGDTLYSLARRFGLSVQALANYNRLADPSKISVGQRLRIPSSATVPTTTPTARPTPPRVHGVDCAFRFGFKELYDHIPDIVGQCLENEQHNVSGDSFQHTTGGLLFWNKADNLTTFTDGVWTWIAGRDGPQKRRNRDRATWDPPDPVLVEALAVLRTTSTGERIYTTLMHLGATAKFGLLEGVSSYSAFRNLIVISEKYRSESPEALAHTLIWPAVGLFNEAERAQSWSECMERVIDQETTQAQWWRELFGEDGKGDPTNLERWANYEVVLLVTESLPYWVQLTPHYREQCAKYGAPPQRIDPVLARAYQRALLGGKSALGRAAAETITTAHSDVVFGKTDGSYGYYSPSRSRIVVSEEIRDESADVQAAVLIHETIHVAQYSDSKKKRSPAECITEEIEAFKAEAQWWAERYGRDGKDQPNRVEQRMNNLVLAWRAERLEEFVLLSDGYQEQCLGGIVDS